MINALLNGLLNKLRPLTKPFVTESPRGGF